jgi:hypothetical protein
MAGWRENHREYLLSTAHSLSIPEEQFRAVADEVGTALLESIRRAFGNSAPWWSEPQRDLPYWGSRLPEDQSFRLITRVVPDPTESAWFLALSYGEEGLVFDSVPRVVERLLGETHLFEYAVVSKRLDWLIGEEHHSVFVGVGQPIVERLRALVGHSAR